MSQSKFRLVTRSDFDGLVCAVLLKELDLIDDIKFVHPKDMQDGRIDITSRDITTNLPYVAAAHLAFDHHESETIRNTGERPNHIISAHAPSAARVVYDYYGGAAAFPKVSDEMMQAVDKADSAQFSHDEILHPAGWVLLNYLMDSRTGLGRFREFRVSNYQLMMDLIDYCRSHGIDDADRALRQRAQKPGGAGLAQRGNHLRRQPFHDLRAVPAVQHLDPRDVGCAKAKHRVGHRQVDSGSQQQNQCGRADAAIRWRRPQCGGHLPGGQPAGRASVDGLDPTDQP
ncbi:MAG: hypothetical protein FD135_537 [Comamonadaceae bacterium]|nr:MAG: hypothetical protein FD135_537 [Comamonadaceae bacterium]